MQCRDCGWVPQCHHCEVSLTYHKTSDTLRCHYCGYWEHRPTACPVCGSPRLDTKGFGTQQVEDEAARLFESARILRMDTDTTSGKNSYRNILQTFEQGRADILIGTQMIVKGHDFPNVTLVGILAADMSLYTDDYRSGERTFQLLTQAVGRAGRGDKKGEAVIQTYSPDHYAIATSAAQDYEAFYEEEIRYRTMMGYPPAENLLAVFISSADEALLETGCRYLKEYMIKAKKDIEASVIGPASPGIEKINDVYRKVIYVKTADYHDLVVLKDRTEKYIEIKFGI